MLPSSGTSGKDAEYQAQMDADLRNHRGREGQRLHGLQMVRDGLGFDQPKANGSYYDGTVRCKPPTVGSKTLARTRCVPAAGRRDVLHRLGVRKTISRTLRTQASMPMCSRGC